MNKNSKVYLLGIVFIICLLLIFTIFFTTNLNDSESSKSIENNKQNKVINQGINWNETKNSDNSYTRIFYGNPINLKEIVNLTEDGDDLLLEWGSHKVKIILNVKEKNKPEKHIINIKSEKEDLEYTKNINYSSNKYKFDWKLKDKKDKKLNIESFYIEIQNLTPMNIRYENNIFYLSDSVMINLKDLIDSNFTLETQNNKKVKIKADSTKGTSFDVSEILLDPEIGTYGSKDNYIDDPTSGEDENYGSSTSARFDDVNFRALIDFDITSIPENSTVTNADISLYFQQASSGDTKYAYPIIKSWNEGTGDGDENDGTINGTTWLERWYGDNANDGCSGDGDEDWCTGGLAGDTDWNGTYVSSFIGGTNYQSFDVTDWINLVVNKKEEFYGYILINQDGSDHIFYTRDYSGTTRDPYINITYDLPEVNVSVTNIVNDSTTSDNTIEINCTSKADLNTAYGNTSGIYTYVFDTPDEDPPFAIQTLMDKGLNTTTTPKRNSTVSWSNTTTELDDGAYYLICASDILFEDVDTEYIKYGYSDEIKITIDTTAPEISFINPTPPNNSRETSNSVIINVSVSDLSEIDTCIVEWNNTDSVTNYTMTKIDNYCNYTFSTDDGIEYWFKVFANDTSNLLGNSSIRTFIENNVSTTPSVTLTPITAYANDTLICTGSGSTDSDGDNLFYYYQFNDSDGTILQDYNTFGDITQEDNNYIAYDYVNATSDDSIPLVFGNDWESAEGFYSINGVTNDQLYINYTIPSLLTNALLDIKYDIRPGGTLYGFCLNSGGSYISIFTDNTDNNVERKNFTINSDCFSTPTLQLKINVSNTDVGYSLLFEEQLHWNVSTSTFNCSADADCTKGDNITCNVKVNDGYEYSSINSTNITIQNYPPMISSWNISNSTWSITSGEDIIIYENSTGNGTYIFNITQITDIDNSETHLYDFKLDGTSKQTGTQSNYNWILGSDTPGEYNLTVSLNDSDNAIDTNYWNVTIKDIIFPSFSNIIEYPTDPTNWETTKNYFFNTTITESHLDTIGIEWGGTNYTAEISQIGNVFMFNRSSLLADTYNYYWWANDTSNNMQFSDSQTYTINKAIPTGNLTNTTSWTIEYGTEVTIGLSESNTGDGDLTYIVYRDDVSKGTGETWTPDVGTYDYILNTTGGANYSANASMDTETLTVTKISSTTTLSFDKASPQDYGESLNASCITDGDGTLKLYRNGVDVTAIEMNEDIILGANTHNYVCNVTEGTNYAYSEDTSPFTISKVAGDVTLRLNGNEANTTAIYPQETNVTSTTNYGSVTIYREGNDITSENGLNVSRTSGYYNITSISSGDENHSISFQSYWLNVSKGSRTVNVIFDKASSQDYKTTLNTSCTISVGSEDGDLKLYRNGVDVTATEMNQDIILGANTHNYVCNVTEGTNYTTATDSDTFTIDKIIPNGDLTNTTSWTIEYGTEIIVGLSESNTGDGDLTYIVYRDDVSKGTGETWTPDVGIYDYILNTTGGANYSANASMDTETLTIEDTIKPNIQITNPTNLSNISDTTEEVRYTFSDGNIDTCWWDDGTTTTMLASCGTNITGVTWNEGFNNITIYANDTSNNINSSFVQFRLDTIPPSFDHELADQTIFQNDSFQYDINASDVGVGMSGYIINSTYSLFAIEFDTGNLTNTSTLVGQVGEYYFNVSINDTSNNKNTSILFVNITAIPDTILPIINLIHPTNTSYTFQSIDINYTITDETAVSYCWYSNDSGGTNSTPQTCGTNWTVVYADGGHNVIVYGNDTANNLNSTNISFFIDSTYPLIQIINPTNLSNISDTTKEVNYTFSDTNVDTCWWDDGTTTTMLASCGVNITGQTWVEGVNNITVWINDSLNNINSSFVQFRLDTTFPNIEIVYPSNNTNTSDTGLDVNYIYSDLNIDKCWWGNETTNTTIACGTNITDIVWNEGLNNITIYINDTSNNVNSSFVRFRLDTGNPGVVLLTPPNATYNNTDQNFTADLTDAQGLKNASLYIYDESDTLVNQTDFFFGENVLTYTVGTVVVLTGGIYNWFYIAFDWAGNWFAPATNNTITIDKLNPNILIVLPANLTNTTNTQIDVNYTYNDTNVNTCWWGNETTNTTLTCGVNITDQTWNEGLNNITLYVNDSALNTNSSFVQFRLDTTFPNIQIVYPPNNTNTTDTQIDVNYTYSDLNIDKCWWGNETTNTTIACGTNITDIVWNEGLNNITIYINDTSNNVNSSFVRFRLDTGNPGVVLLTPPNATYNNTDQNFSANLTDLQGLKNASLYIYDDVGSLINQTDFFFGENVLKYTVGAVVVLTSGIYNWFYVAFDWADNWFAPVTNNTITIDKINPGISYDATTDSNNSWKQSGDIFINVTVSDINKNLVRLEWQGINETFDNSEGDNYWENKTGLSTGSYSFYTWINDLAGNFNSTLNRTINLDLEDPYLNIDSPKSQSYNKNNVSLNYTITDTNLDSCWFFILNSTGEMVNVTGGSNEPTVNTSLPNCLNTTFNISEGTGFKLYLYANDSSGRVNNDLVTFDISLAPPEVSLDAPADDIWLNYSTNIYFNYTATDSGGISVCELWGNWTGVWHNNYTWISPPSGVMNYTTLSLNDGSFEWNVWCNDTGNNGVWGNVAGNNTINIDTIFPLIDYGNGVLPTETNTTNNFIFVNASVTEINEDVIIFNLYNQTSIVNSTPYLDETRIINWTNLNDDIYSFNVSINDTTNNINTTETYLIRLDDTEPDVEIYLPLGAYATNTSIPLNYSSVDEIVGVDTCWYKVENSTDIIIDNTILENCKNTTFNVPEGDIDYVVTIYSNDTLNNIGDLSSAFDVRTISPAITLKNPSANKYINRIDNIRFNFTSIDASESISVCELWGNWTGVWHKNQTITSVSEINENNFDLIDLLEESYSWNVWCNDTLDNSGWALNNRTFTLDITIPTINITKLTTKLGSQTFTFNSTTTDLYNTACKYSIYNSSGSIDGLNENVSYTCNSQASPTVSAYSTYNLTIYSIDLAGNENTTTKEFTTSPTLPSPGGGGGTSITVVQGAEQTLNFTITTTNLQSNLDISLAKDSVKPRRKQLFITNKAKEPFEVVLVCEASNKSDICKYVELSQTIITLSPNEEERASVYLSVTTPKDSPFGQEDFFNIIAYRNETANILYSKLSVKTSVSFFATLFYKWINLPNFGSKSVLEQDTTTSSSRFPVSIFALTLSFLLFIITFISFRKFEYNVAGFFLGIVLSTISYVLLVIII